MNIEFFDGPADGEVLDLAADIDPYLFELRGPEFSIRYHYQRNWENKFVYRGPEVIPNSPGTAC